MADAEGWSLDKNLTPPPGEPTIVGEAHPASGSAAPDDGLDPTVVGASGAGGAGGAGPRLGAVDPVTGAMWPAAPQAYAAPGQAQAGYQPGAATPAPGYAVPGQAATGHQPGAPTPAPAPGYGAPGPTPHPGVSYPGGPGAGTPYAGGPQPLGGPGSPYPGGAQPPPSGGSGRGKGLLIAGLLAVVAVLLVAVGVLVLARGGSDDSSADPDSPTSAQVSDDDPGGSDPGGNTDVPPTVTAPDFDDPADDPSDEPDPTDPDPSDDPDDTVPDPTEPDLSDLRGDLPADLPQPPGSTPSSIGLGITVPDMTVEEVVAFYAEALPAAGYTVQDEVTTSGTSVFVITEPESASLTIYEDPLGGGVLVAYFGS